MFKPALALRDQHQLLHANVLELDQQNRRASYELINDKAAGVQWLQWDYLVYALGSHLPDPINVWSSSGEQGSRQHDGSKIMGVQWLRDAQDRIEKAESIVIIGGGALGVQLATDIAVTYGRSKRVTLTHSRAQLLPRFDPWMHERAAARLSELGVELVLGSRVDLGSLSSDKRSFRLLDGRQLEGDLTVSERVRVRIVVDGSQALTVLFDDAVTAILFGPNTEHASVGRIIVKRVGHGQSRADTAALWQSARIRNRRCCGCLRSHQCRPHSVGPGRGGREEHPYAHLDQARPRSGRATRDHSLPLRIRISKCRTNATLRWSAVGYRAVERVWDEAERAADAPVEMPKRCAELVQASRAVLLL
ncbi:hypothetical protein L1887_44350 [Cichorium endivia]|nr:hypothetical protein L1887_44350 [Cichorium endivia]